MADPATLLVADDDPGLRESLERTLTREGYKVVLASDGRAALERVQAGGVDLIVTDLRMPGLTGLELLRAAKAIMPDVEYRRNAHGVARGADAIVIVTEWNEFKQLDMLKMKRLMRRPVIVDGRNLYDPAEMRRLGFVYRGIGRN